MAVDTATKRASVLGFTLAARLVLPIPDGTIGQADRQHVAYSYAGLTAQAALLGEPDEVILIRADDRTILVPNEG